MLGFSPLSQDALATSGVTPVDITVTLTAPSQATTAIGNGFTIQGDSILTLGGVGANGQVGTGTEVEIDIVVPISGWGAGNWGSGTWGNQVILPQGTTAVGSNFTIITGSSDTLTGVQATTGTNSLIVDTGTGNVVTLSGVQGTLQQIENVTVVEGQGISFTLTGVEATASTDEVSITVTTSVSVTVGGVQATSQVGSGIIVTGDSILTLEGVGANIHTKSVIIKTGLSFDLVGISASTFIGNVLIWGNVIPAPGNTWTELVPNPTNSWGGSTPNPGNTWTGTTPNPGNTWTAIVPNPGNNWDDAA
mgnify:CR=1 FL=1